MGMKIEGVILYMELYKRNLLDSVSDLDKDIEAYDTAIDTMRKYRKIKEIVKKWELDSWTDNFSYESMIRIREVIEDGNDNYHASNAQ